MLTNWYKCDWDHQLVQWTTETEPSSPWRVQWSQRGLHMPEWITQLVALVALLGIVGLCFWKARGVKPRRGKRPRQHDNTGPTS
jgi:hypothetical protein